MRTNRGLRDEIGVRSRLRKFVPWRRSSGSREEAERIAALAIPFREESWQPLGARSGQNRWTPKQ
jgi:hypothetical protein